MTSRTLRKRQRAAFSDDIDFDLEKLLNDHEEKGIAFRAERDAKKIKDEEEAEYADAFSGYTIALDSLPALCLERIMAMLESPQDLYNLTFLSPLLMNIVTPEVVIRSAVFSNMKRKDIGYRKTMSDIMTDISNRSIRIPSQFRLLRLLNAKSCERGEKCYGKNLNTGRSMTLSGSHLACGMALCDKCIKFTTTKIPHQHFVNNIVGDDKNPSHIAFASWRTITDPYQSDTGEWHGPLMSVLELQQIDNSFPNQNEKKEALAGFVKKVLTENSSNCPFHYEEKAMAYCEIHRDAEKEADDYIEKKLKAQMQKYDENKQERITKRLAKTRAIHASMENVLMGCALKDLALDCTWNEESENCLRFACCFVQEQMSSLLSAPSSASKLAVTARAKTIKLFFNVLDEKSFFSYSFLANSSSRFKKALYEYCVNNLPPERFLQSRFADVTFFRLVEENKLTSALVRALNGVQDSLENVFSLSMARTREDEDAEARVARYQKLAKCVWTKKNSLHSSEIMGTRNLKDKYALCIDEFRIMKKNAKDYLASEESHVFLRRVAEGGGVLSRQETLNLAFAPRITNTWVGALHRSVSPYEELLHRRFYNLRTIHEDYFRNPNSYNIRREDALA